MPSSRLRSRVPRFSTPALLCALLLACGLPVDQASAASAPPAAAAGTASAATAPPASAAPVAASVVPTAASNAAATPTDTPLYQVEVVIFRVESVSTAEDWSSLPPGHGFGTPLGNGAPVPQLVNTLPPSNYRLDGVVNGLRRSGAWRPLAHVAWVQSAPPWGSHTGLPLSQLGVDAPGLSGTVYLERARHYLELGFDVTLDAGGAPYRIVEMHNIQANEKQYYDHPGFGIIAAVYPIKHPGR